MGSNAAHKTEHTALLKDLMAKPPVSVSLTYTVLQVLKLAKKHNVTGFPIVDMNSRVIGVVSTYDLITDISIGKLHSKLGELPLTLKVEKDVIKLNQLASVKDVLKTIIKERVGRVIIVDDKDKLVGVVSRKDIINYFVDYYELDAELPYR